MERDVEKNESIAQLKDVLSGILPGSLAKIIEYPFDTIKVLSQIENSSNVSTSHIIRQIYYKEGINRLFRGLSAPLLGSIGENIIFFWCYGASERYLKKMWDTDRLSTLQLAVAGGLTGIGVSMWMTPVEFIKCQMQAPNTAKQYDYSTFKCFRHQMCTNPLNIFSGLSATLNREIPGTIIYLLGYRVTSRKLQEIFHKDEPTAWMIFASGAASGLTYWTIIYPIDTLKSEIQTQDYLSNVNNGNKVGIWTMLKNRYYNKGFRSLYNGLGVTVPRAILSNAVIFGSYEYSRKFWDNAFDYFGNSNEARDIHIEFVDQS